MISNRPSIDEVETSLNSLKTDIITQFINIFNQISFVAEQEEIIDFIQEKLLGNTCGRRPTSCADQLAKAVKSASLNQN